MRSPDEQKGPARVDPSLSLGMTTFGPAQKDNYLTVTTPPAEKALNSGAYMDWTVAGETLKTPDMLARSRYLNVYSPTGSCSKKKFVPESRVSSYQEIPRSHL